MFMDVVYDNNRSGKNIISTNSGIINEGIIILLFNKNEYILISKAQEIR